MAQPHATTHRTASPRGGAFSGAAFGAAALLVSAPAIAQTRQADCNAVKNARVVAADGTFLGTLNDATHRDSLLNRTGPYGSKTAANSLWNTRGPYGSVTSGKSPMNSEDGKPASIVKDGQTIARLMRNSLRSWYEDPAKLVYRCFAFVP